MAKLTAKQEKFIVALMQTNTVVDACKQAGITSNTGHKYLNDPDFKQEYLSVRRETMQQATNKLQQSALIAVETLNQVMVDVENSTPSARVQASRVVLENAYRGLELEDLQQRIEQLEERLGS